MLIFYDAEVFKYDWMFVLIDPFNRTEDIIVNDTERFEAFYNEHKNDIWIGYNSRNYDQFIVKGILCGFNPYDISNHIIKKKKNGYQFSRLLNNFQLYNYDVAYKFNSLKQCEGFMGNDIRETSVPFDIDRKLTPEEIKQTIHYCRHDVEQSIEVFLEQKSDFDAHLDVIKTFKLPLSYISKTQAQLTAAALGCKRQDHNDEWEISFVPTIQLNKYKYIWDWFRDPENYKHGEKLTVDVCGVPHTFGLGGIHGAPKIPIYRKGLIIHVDVTSYYPSLMIVYDLLSRNVKDKQIFKDIYDKRVALKKAGKKKEQAPYKIILNATFGITNDPYSLAYDPRRNHEVCINGQLLLLDLLENLEGHCELLQSNTDGLIIMIPDTDEAFNTIDDICYEWEQRTGMGLGFDIITEIWQKDVNNYLFKFDDGKLERKGAYVKELSKLDNDLPIVNKALIEYMANNVPVKDTILNCNDLKMFQKVVKISGNYLRGVHNGEVLNDKTFRVFASNVSSDSYIGKQKSVRATVEKFGNTPEHCFIDNSDINGKSVPPKLDRWWYIDLAVKRLLDFGLEVK
ncbi:hypothetical protein [Priestia megaterium]|uniref:hypothetical protein n=1 Tax=Priestia megaterium TaxID=1404 RepID=UPI002E1C4F45|nr:hypothetical protein [Priestia megaterium]